jgi:hypothetical protein
VDSRLESAEHGLDGFGADVRRFLVHRFHYVIRYRIVAATDTVEFLSIVHTSRHPNTVTDR